MPKLDLAGHRQDCVTACTARRRSKALTRIGEPRGNRDTTAGRSQRAMPHPQTGTQIARELCSRSLLGHWCHSTQTRCSLATFPGMPFPQPPPPWRTQNRLGNRGPTLRHPLSCLRLAIHCDGSHQNRQLESVLIVPS